MEGPAVKVYVDDDDGRQTVGRADVPEDCGPVYEVPAVTEALAVLEEFAVGTVVTHVPEGGGAPRWRSGSCWRCRGRWWNCCPGGGRWRPERARVPGLPPSSGGRTCQFSCKRGLAGFGSR